MGIIVPWVNSREEAEMAVKACKYPPKGIRGCGPRRAAKYGLETLSYLKSADEEIVVVVQIETVKAVESIKEILSVDGVDATFVGPWTSPRLSDTLETLTIQKLRRLYVR